MSLLAKTIDGEELRVKSIFFKFHAIVAHTVGTQPVGVCIAQVIAEKSYCLPPVAASPLVTSYCPLRLRSFMIMKLFSVMEGQSIDQEAIVGFEDIRPLPTPSEVFHLHRPYIFRLRYLSSLLIDRELYHLPSSFYGHLLWFPRAGISYIKTTLPDYTEKSMSSSSSSFSVDYSTVLPESRWNQLARTTLEGFAWFKEMVMTLAESSAQVSFQYNLHYSRTNKRFRSQLGGRAGQESRPKRVSLRRQSVWRSSENSKLEISERSRAC